MTERISDDLTRVCRKIQSCVWVYKYEVIVRTCIVIQVPSSWTQACPESVIMPSNNETTSRIPALLLIRPPLSLHLPITPCASKYGKGSNYADQRDSPRKPLDDLEFVAFAQASSDTSHAATLDETEKGVDKNSGNDPEYSAQDDEYLLGRTMEKDVSDQSW